MCRAPGVRLCCLFHEELSSFAFHCEGAPCNNVFQVLLEAQARPNENDGLKRLLRAQPVIIPRKSDTCSQGVTMNFDGVRNDRKESDENMLLGRRLS